MLRSLIADLESHLVSGLEKTVCDGGVEGGVVGIADADADESDPAAGDDAGAVHDGADGDSPDVTRERGANPAQDTDEEAEAIRAERDARWRRRLRVDAAAARGCC